MIQSLTATDLSDVVVMCGITVYILSFQYIAGTAVEIANTDNRQQHGQMRRYEAIETEHTPLAQAYTTAPHTDFMAVTSTIITERDDTVDRGEATHHTSLALPLSVSCCCCTIHKGPLRSTHTGNNTIDSNCSDCLVCESNLGWEWLVWLHSKLCCCDIQCCSCWCRMMSSINIAIANSTVILVKFTACSLFSLFFLANLAIRLLYPVGDVSPRGQVALLAICIGVVKFLYFDSQI